MAPAPPGLWSTTFAVAKEETKCRLHLDWHRHRRHPGQAGKAQPYYEVAAAVGLTISTLQLDGPVHLLSLAAVELRLYWPRARRR